MPAVLVPIITSIGAAIGGVTGAFLIMESAAVASGIILGGLLAFGAAQAKRAKDAARAAYNAAQVDRMANVVATVALCELVLGRVRKGGVVWFRDSAGAKKEIFGMAMALAAHEIDAIEQVYCNDVPVELDDDGWVRTEPWGRLRRVSVPVLRDVQDGFSGSGVADASGQYTIADADLIADSVTCYMEVTDGAGQSSLQIVAHGVAGVVVTTEPFALVIWERRIYTKSLRIWWNLGTDDQDADTWLRATFPDSFTADHRARGVANLFVEARYDETAFTGGLPRITVRMRGAKVLDPRTDATAWSENPALLMRHVYQHAWFGRSTVTEDEDARLIAAANACDDEYAYTVDGVEQAAVALYRGALVVQFGTPAGAVLDDLAQAMGGSWCHARGELFVRAGAYTASVLTLTADDLAVVATSADGSADRRAISITAHRERAQQVNTANVRLWDSAADYRETALAPLSPAALVARDGSVLAQELVMPAIAYAPQALHVAGIILRDSRDPLTVTASFKLRAIQAEVFDTVTLQLPMYGIDGEFTVQSSERPGDGTVVLALKEVAEEHFQPDADFTPGGYADNTTLPQPWSIPDVSGLAVTEALAVQADGTVAATLTVSWDAVNHQAVEDNGRVDVQWLRLGVDTQWQQRSVDGDQAAVQIHNVVDGDLYRLRARARSSLAVGDWSAPVNHQVVGKTAPPADVGWLLISGDVLTWAPVADLDLAGYRVRAIGGATPAWAMAAALNDGLITETRHRLITPLPGLVTYMVKAVDTSGNESAATASVTTVGSVVLAGNTLESWPQASAFAGEITGGTVTGGVLEADATGDLFWGGDSAPFWGADADAFWPAATYGELVYGFTIGISAAGRLVIDDDITASAYTVEMRRHTSGGAAWGDDADLYWGADPDDFWPDTANVWEPWPGYLDVSAGALVDFRVTAAAGATRGRIVTLTPYLDVPTVEEFIDDAAVSGGGTRLALTQTFRAISNVQLTPVQDGGTAVVARLIDKNHTSGPLVEMLDTSGASVAGVVDARIKGY